jgi:hypothetical protein
VLRHLLTDAVRTSHLATLADLVVVADCPAKGAPCEQHGLF